LGESVCAYWNPSSIENRKRNDRNWVDSGTSGFEWKFEKADIPGDAGCARVDIWKAPEDSPLLLRH